MNWIMRVLGYLEDSGYITSIPVPTPYTSPEFDANGHMIGTCNTCCTKTISSCRDCKFFLCTRCTCDVCK